MPFQGMFDKCPYFGRRVLAEVVRDAGVLFVGKSDKIHVSVPTGILSGKPCCSPRNFHKCAELAQGGKSSTAGLEKSGRVFYITSGMYNITRVQRHVSHVITCSEISHMGLRKFISAPVSTPTKTNLPTDTKTLRSRTHHHQTPLHENLRFKMLVHQIWSVALVKRRQHVQQSLTHILPCPPVPTSLERRVVADGTAWA